MLIQSTPQSIIPLPALPKEWKTGSFSGLRARGAFTVDAKWKDGVVTDLTIKSDKGGKTTIIVNSKEIAVDLNAGESKNIVRNN